MKYFPCVFIVAACVCFSCKKNTNEQTPVKKALAFTIQKDNSTTLWYMATDKTSLGMVLEDDLGTSWNNPTWSPDGRTIYYIKNSSQNGQNGVYSIKPNGQDPKTVYKDDETQSRNFYQLTSSTDNENLIFSLDIPRTGRKVIELYRMCPCGTQVKRLTEFESSQPDQKINTEAYGGSFAPGDSILVFSQGDPSVTGKKDVNIYQINVLTKVQKLLTKVQAVDVAATTASYSPDGKTLLLSIDGSIYSMNADGTGLKSFGDIKGFRPMWDKDGTSFYFTSYNISGMQAGIYKADFRLRSIEMISKNPSLGIYGGFAVNGVL